jgi:hypothetical protein
MVEKIETFYTGGGITIAETDVDNGHYAVVSSEAPDFLSVYAFSDGEKTYLPDDMISSSSEESLTPELKALYRKMLDKLKTA